jgi:hypothetical protein
MQLPQQQPNTKLEQEKKQEAVRVCESTPTFSLHAQENEMKFGT